MKYTHYFLLIIACFAHNQITFSIGLISLHLSPFPHLINDENCSAMNNHLKTPGKISSYCLYGVLDQHVTAGIYATYGGYLNVSDELGNLIFPYQHNKPTIKLVITNKITPILMAGNTIHHWELEKEVHAMMYSMKRSQDPDTKLFYWETAPMPLPDNLRIPIDALVILANPSDIYVPIGATDTQESPHLILPTIYVKKENDIISHALYALNLKHFFTPVRFDYKKEKQRYIKQFSTSPTP